MEIRNQSSVPQFAETGQVSESQGSRPSQMIGKVVGKIGSIFGFKASFASPVQQQTHLAQNSATKQQIESRIIAIDKQLESLPSKESIRASDSLQRQLQEEALHNTKLTLGQEKGRLLEQLASGNYSSPAASSKPIPATTRSSSTATVSRSPLPPTRSSRSPAQAELEQYQKDKRQIAVNESLMEKSSGFYSAADKSRIAQDTWDRQLRVDQYEKDHPEVLNKTQ